MNLNTILRPGSLLATALLLASLACGGGGGGAPAAPAGPATPATVLAYVNPTDATAWRLMQGAATTPTHLVLDLVAPAGTSGQGVTLVLTSDLSRAAWSTLDGTHLVNQGAYASPKVNLGKVHGSDLRILVSQAQGTAVSYGSSPVLQVSLDLVPGAPAGSVALAATQGGHLGVASTPTAMTVAVGSLQAK